MSTVLRPAGLSASRTASAAANPLRILFVTPECAPWVKSGGLGDVSAALPQALRALWHEVRVLMPAYRPLRPLLATSRKRYTVPADGPWPEAQLVEVHAEGLNLLLLDCPGFYDRPGSAYGNTDGVDFEDGLRRFAFLSHVAARVASGGGAAFGLKWKADVLHANDWPTGLAMAYLQEIEQERAKEGGEHRTAGVFTIHNLAFQGLFPVKGAAAIHLPQSWLNIEGLLHWEKLCLLKAGIRYADAVTTVSPTYAREIQTPEMGCGLDGLIRARAERLHGILNGIDGATWNPAHDARLTKPYSAATLADKAVNKRALQQEVGLAIGSDEGGGRGPMLFGTVSRLTEQKGLDLVLANIDWLVNAGHQLVILGRGDASLERALLEAAARHPSRVAVIVGFDETLAHRIEAGADAFLMPSRFEPCGLNQMYSQAYGTPPIVHATGGLADSVDDVPEGPEGPEGDARGTGFRFDRTTPEALRGAMERAVRLWHNPPAWSALQLRAMAREFDWEFSARQYESMYRGLLTASALAA